MKVAILSEVVGEYSQLNLSDHFGVQEPREIEEKLNGVIWNPETFWKNHLIELGVEARCIYAEVASYTEQNLSTIDYVLSELNEFRPDVLYVPMFFIRQYNEYLAELKKSGKIKKMVTWVGEARPEDLLFPKLKDYDLILTCDPTNVDFFEKKGFPTAHLHHGFEKALIEQNYPVEKGNIVGYTGSFYVGKHLHNQRIELISYLLTRAEFDIRGKVIGDIGVPAYGLNKDGVVRTYFGVSQLVETTLGEKIAGKLPKRGGFLEFRENKRFAESLDRIRKAVQPSVFGHEMYAFLHNHDVVLNVHSPTEYACNQRMFEASGMGCCLLTDAKKNMATLFEEDKEVVTYSTKEEAAEKLLYLQKHPEEAREIGKAAQQRAVRDHNYTIRTTRMHELYAGLLK